MSTKLEVLVKVLEANADFSKQEIDDLIVDNFTNQNRSFYTIGDEAFEVLHDYEYDYLKYGYAEGLFYDYTAELRELARKPQLADMIATLNEEECIKIILNYFDEEKFLKDMNKVRMDTDDDFIILLVS